MKKFGIIIMCLLLYACESAAPTWENTQITEYTVTKFANHRIWIIDYCGLIEKGLALEAPVGMYN